jgi:hypothetical protein
MPGQLNADLIYVGSPDRVTGAIMSAAKGTALPTDASSAPTGPYADSGYISEDGCTLSDAQTWVDIKDWGGDTVRRIKSESQVTIAFSFLEINDRSAKAAFGDNNVTATGGELEIHLNVQEPPRKVWIINMLDGDRYLRITVADGQITDRGDLTFTRSGAILIPVTLTCYPDANGDACIIYAEGPAGAGAATGATAGTPGTWTPGGSTPPANAAGATSAGVTASPATAWTTGQYVQGSTAGTSGEMYWNGTAWTAGKAA